MLTHDDWFRLLGIQAADIDSLDRAIKRRHASGKSTAYAQSVLAEMIREHRDALSRAPIDVLFALGADQDFSPHS